jgi:hypothetical protein
MKKSSGVGANAMAGRYPRFWRTWNVAHDVPGDLDSNRGSGPCKSLDGCARSLASLWTAAPDRRLITSAANALDGILEIDAHRQGESRGGALRIILVEPLGADVEVDENARDVWVLRVWRYEKRSR